MRHLHRDYLMSWCGLDASHIPMTYGPTEADCAECHTALSEHLVAIAERKAEDREAEAQFQRDRADALARAGERGAALKEEAEQRAAAQAQRDAEQLREWINP